MVRGACVGLDMHPLELGGISRARALGVGIDEWMRSIKHHLGFNSDNDVDVESSKAMTTLDRSTYDLVYLLSQLQRAPTHVVLASWYFSIRSHSWGLVRGLPRQRSHLHLARCLIGCHWKL